MSADGSTRLTQAASILHVGRQPLRVSAVGRGRPLLLCNGLAGPIESWGPFVDALSGVRVIAFDAPGVGDSPAARGPLTIGKVATLATAVLDHVGVERADVLGYSWGGAVAQHLAWRHAARVERLVLAASSTGAWSVPGLPVAFAPVLLSMLWGAGPRRPRTSPLGFCGQVGAIGTWTSLPWLHQLRAPTLVVHGGADYLVPAINAHVLAWGIPTAQLELLPRADHFLFEPRHVAAVAREVAAFLPGR